MSVDISIDHTIITHLIYSDEYARKVLPFLKSEYFHDSMDKTLFDQVNNFYTKYSARPTVEALRIEIDTIKGLGETEYNNISQFLSNIVVPDKTPDKWLMDATESYCADKAMYNAIMDGIAILDGRDKEKRDKGALPKIMADALAVSFDTNIGHDFLENSDDRYELYHRVEERVPFDLDMFNIITRGGFPKKTLNVFIMGVGVGKTLTMCHLAAANLTLGKQVLYITLEMSESEISKRIDANLMDVNIEVLEEMGKEEYTKKIDRIKSKTKGKLIVKEFPTGGAHAGHFRHLINELHLKKNFIPDIIYIDYINICSSSRSKMSLGSVNSYTYIKSIAEELRGLGVEKNVPIVSATQLNRTGFQNADPGMSDTAESFGLPATVDWLCAGVSSEELQAINKLMFKQLKSRYNDINKNLRFVCGINKSKMRLFDVPDATSAFTTDADAEDVPLFDKSSSGRRTDESDTRQWHGKDPDGNKPKKNFSSFQF